MDSPNVQHINININKKKVIYIGRIAPILKVRLKNIDGGGQARSPYSYNFINLINFNALDD